MKIKFLGFGAGFLLGAGLILAGLFSMSFHSPNDNTGIMIVLGALFLIPGIIIFSITLFSWISAKLYNSSDVKTKRNVKIGVFVLLLAWFTWPNISVLLQQANAPLDYNAPDFPLDSGTLGGNIVSVQSWNNQETNPLEVISTLQSGDTVKLLGVGKYKMEEGIHITPSKEGFPWFIVEYNEDQKGYMWGGNLCATYSWANGLNRRCPFSSALPPAKDLENKEQQALLDLIEYSNDKLPGTWVETSNQKPDEINSILVIYPQESADHDYARRVQKYYLNDIHKSVWKILPAKSSSQKQSTPNLPQVTLTVSSEISFGNVYGNIVSLSTDELVLSANGYNKTHYQRVAEPAQLIEKWEKQVAVRKTIAEANAPRREIARQAPQAIKGMPNAVEQTFAEPFSVLSHMGKIRSGPGTQFSQVGSLTRGKMVYVLAVTNVRWHDSLWYRIRHSNGVEGYVAGALICADDRWIEGVARNCRHFL